jgi:hypothetical protein
MADSEAQQCRYINSNGMRCNRRTLSQDELCFQHSEDRRRRCRPAYLPIEIPLLDNRPAVAALLTEVARAIVHQALSLPMAAELRQIARVALVALPRPHAPAVKAEAVKQDAPAIEPVYEVVRNEEGEPLAPEARYYGPNGKPERAWSFSEWQYRLSFKDFPEREHQPLPEEGFRTDLEGKRYVESDRFWRPKLPSDVEAIEENERHMQIVHANKIALGQLPEGTPYETECGMLLRASQKWKAEHADDEQNAHIAELRREAELRGIEWDFDPDNPPGPTAAAAPIPAASSDETLSAAIAPAPAASAPAAPAPAAPAPAESPSSESTPPNPPHLVPGHLSKLQAAACCSRASAKSRRLSRAPAERRLLEKESPARSGSHHHRLDAAAVWPGKFRRECPVDLHVHRSALHFAAYFCAAAPAEMFRIRRLEIDAPFGGQIRAATLVVERDAVGSLRPVGNAALSARDPFVRRRQVAAERRPGRKAVLPCNRRAPIHADMRIPESRPDRQIRRLRPQGPCQAGCRAQNSELQELRGLHRGISRGSLP